MRSIDKNNLKYGFWIYNGDVFLNKIQLFEKALENKDYNPNARFYFNDHIYNITHSMGESSKSLSTLYTERARQIREKYDYVILLFSGGSDSNEILNTFLENNIFLDEIQTLFPTKLVGNYDFSKTNPEDDVSVLAEIQLSAYPKLLEVAQKSPKTKIRIIDTSDRFLSINDNTIDFMNHFVNLFFPTTIDVAFTDEENIKIALRNNTCLILGNEKPIINISDDGTFNLMFHDFCRQFDTYISGKLENPLKFENFYWSPDLPQIPLKQGYVLFRQLQKEIKEKNYNNLLNIKQKKSKEIANWEKSIIYNYWDNRYQSNIIANNWHSWEKNIYKFVPKIFNINEEKRIFYKKKFSKIENNSFENSPFIKIFYSQKYPIGKLSFE